MTAERLQASPRPTKPPVALDAAGGPPSFAERLSLVERDSAAPVLPVPAPPPPPAGGRGARAVRAGLRGWAPSGRASQTRRRPGRRQTPRRGMAGPMKGRVAQARGRELLPAAVLQRSANILAARLVLLEEEFEGN